MSMLNEIRTLFRDFLRHRYCRPEKSSPILVPYSPPVTAMMGRAMPIILVADLQNNGEEPVLPASVIKAISTRQNSSYANTLPLKCTVRITGRPGRLNRCTKEARVIEELNNEVILESWPGKFFSGHRFRRNKSDVLEVVNIS